jgi:muramoyltetrapeptide carboxypeptidase
MIRPLKPNKNPVIGIIATGSKPPKKNLNAGILKLVKLGFTIKDYTSKIGKTINDKSRLGSIYGAFSDPEVDIVMAARGGYGTLRILDKINYDLIGKSRKILIGFSDITALSMAIYRKTKLVTFSGPMIITHFAWPMYKFTKDSFLRNIRGEYVDNTSFEFKDLGGAVLKKGVADGILLGGNLAVFLRMIGSEFLPNLKGTILFIEDVTEHIGRLDNMFAQARLSGVFDKISGLIIGQFSECFKGTRKKQQESLKLLLDDYLADLRIPIVYNMPIGHEDKIMTLPIGIPVKLDTVKRQLVFKRNPVV